MPTLSITLTGAQAARIAAALKDEAADAEAQEKADAEAAGLPYTAPTKEQRFERWLVAGLKTTVLNHERRLAINAAVQALAQEL